MSEKPATTTGDGGEGGATGNSEGGTTMAVQKKRLRRVSFAEMTSVHFFDRDEDNETPVDEAAVKASEDGNGSNEREEKKDLLGFRELLDSRGDDEEEDRENGEGDSEDEELAIMRRTFLRPAESPSPGSTFGSAASNDDAEDGFFGPVSASFIKPGCLSDSAASNDGCDVTMDSTAFSMHFRSLAWSDSGVELKTPTALRLSFEEKTPTHTNAESSMELTLPKRPISQLASPAGNSGSSDMSLVGEKSSKYDYGRISPGLDALLAEGSKKLHATSASDITVPSKSPQNLESKIFPSDKNVSGLMDIIQNGKEVSSLDDRSGEATGVFSTSPVSHSANDFLSNKSKPLAPDILVDSSNSFPSHLSNMRTSSSHQDKLGLEDKYIQHESPFVELVSSSPATERQILATGTSPVQYVSAVSPRKQRSSSLCNGNVKHHESASSVQKSMSKLNLLEASPFSSFLTARIENSTTGALNFSSYSPLSNFSERDNNDFQMQHLDAPATGTQVQPLEAFQKQVLCASSTDDNQIEGPADGGHIIHSGESTVAAASPFEFTLSEKKMKHDLFRSRSPREKGLVTSGTQTDSLFAEIALDHVGVRKTVSTPKKFVPSPEKELEKNWISPKPQGQLSNEMLHDQLVRLKKIFTGQESASNGGIADSSISTVSPHELGSFSLRRKVQPCSTLVGFSNSNLIDVNHHNQRSSYETIENLRTPTEEKESHFICPMKLDFRPQAGRELPSFEGNHPGGELESAVPLGDTSLKELTLQKGLVDSFMRNSSRKELQIGNDNTSMSNEDILSPSSNRLSSLSRKRSNEMVAVEGINHRNELAASQSSPKLQKVGNHDSRTVACPSEDGAETSAVVINLKHWTDIYSRFLKDSENLLSPLLDKFDRSMIELMEHILLRLQSSKTYMILHSQIFAQKTSVIDDLHHQRLSEARSLLHQIIHKKAKLQLMCLKQQKLQEKMQLLSSGIQESQTLKLKFMHGCKGDAQADAPALQNLVNSRKREVECEKVIAMKQTIEALDKKSTNLIKSLTTACKVKGEQNCTNSITLVTNHLMKKSCCRLIRLDMQMWIIDDVKSKNGSRDIVLNYLHFIIQSLKFSSPPASSMVISYKLEDINIVKNFPNMDARAAFSFVFDAETTWKYSGSRSLAQEIQVTSSLLGNLVDVVQEVQLARIELRHLTQTTFHSVLVGQLHLLLGFFSFESGEKVTLTLDLSCLKRGIYPSEILPSQLTVVYGAKSSTASPLLDEIRDALKSLRAGYTRILRLCRRVAQVIQVSRK